MIEVTTESTEVDIVNGIEASSTSTIDAVVMDSKDLDITVAKKEFVITGDDIYVPVLYDDVPQWMKDLVSLSVNQAIEGVSTSNLAQLNSMLAQFATGYVPLNQYTQSILDLSNADVSLHALIETLNSTYEDGITSANSQIIELQLTKASKDDVTTQVIETISAQLANGNSDIGATIARIDQAILGSNSANALSYQAIIATLESMDGEIAGNASAINQLGSYVGVVDGTVTGTGLLADVSILQKQNDGIIETISGTHKVVLNTQDPDMAQLVTTAEPYASWKASEVGTSIDKRLAHIGDVYIEYINNSNGMKEYVASYKFIRTTVDSTSPYATDSDGFTWALVVDQAAQDAYQQSLNAYDLADNKRRVFVNTPYAPYDIGDLWVRVVNGANQVWRCNTASLTVYSLSHWQIASTDDTKTIALQTGLANGTVDIKLSQAYVGSMLLTDYVAQEIDKEVVVYSGTASDKNALTGMKLNDIFIEKTTATGASGVIVDVVNTYKYNGTLWVQIGNNSNLTALADLADGKRTIFSNGTSLPTNPKVRDMWIPDANYLTYIKGEVYLYDGTAWNIATKYTENLNNFVDNTYTPTVASLQSQVDAKIEYWFQTTDPKVAWTTAALKLAHNGDVWYNTSTKVSQYYSNVTNSWNVISDKDALDAIAAAEAARQLADSKVEVRYGTAAQRDATSNGWTAAEKTSNIGDLWIISDSGVDENKQFRWTGTAWFDIRDKKIIANANAITQLQADVISEAGLRASGDTAVENTVKAYADDVGAGVETKWAYNSTVNINGVYKKSGFGLTTNYTSGSGTEANPYVSEFWIDASRFKFTNSNQTGSISPFTIDATGVTPNITFNGKVAFTNITGTSDLVSTSNIQNAVNNNVTDIDGSKIITGTIGANQINANAISGKIISGGTITGTSIYGSYIEGAIIKASFIDLTSTQTLTNWQQYTPANYPSAYANNFAHKNNGTLLVDSLGYVRLMGNTNIVTQQLVYENNYSGSTMPLTLPTYSIDFYSYSDYKSNTLNRCITSTPTLSIPTSQKIVFCSLTTSTANNTGTTNTIVICYINNDYYEISATGTVAKNSLSYSFSCNIKKNSVVIGSSDSISGVTHIAYIGNLPIQISVKATWSYGGLYPSINIETVNTLSSSTTINYTGVDGKAFQLSYAYSPNRMYSKINVPAITVNG